jgi:hypothetical protein
VIRALALGRRPSALCSLPNDPIELRHATALRARTDPQCDRQRADIVARFCDTGLASRVLPGAQMFPVTKAPKCYTHVLRQLFYRRPGWCKNFQFVENSRGRMPNRVRMSAWRSYRRCTHNEIGSGPLPDASEGTVSLRRAAIRPRALPVSTLTRGTCSNFPP